MNIAILVGNYLPKCSAVGNCIKNVASCLVERGHSVTVICFKQSDCQPYREELNGQTIIRVSTRLMDLRNYADAKLQSHKSLTAFLLRLYTQARRRLRLRIRTDALDPSLQRLYLSALDGMEAVPDVVVPTCMPFEAVMAATDYKIRHNKVKLIPYLFDQYADSGTLYASSRLKASRRKHNLAQERKMLKASDSILHITWEEHVKKEFPEFLGKLHRVEHPLLVQKNSVIQYSLSMKEGYLLYSGRPKEVASHISYSLQLISACLDLSNSLKGASFYLPDDESSVVSYKKTGIEFNKTISSDSEDRLRHSAEWLLSIGKSCSDWGINKELKYMATGKPIIHIAHGHRDEAINTLKRYPLALCLHEDVPFETNLKKMVEFLRDTKGRTMSFQEVARFFNEEVSGAAVEKLIRYARGKILFAGALTAAVKIDYMVDLINQKLKGMSLQIYTSDASQVELENNPNIKTAHIDVHGWVPVDKLPALYEGADCLLSIGEVQGRQLSSKIFGYMSSGMPIVHIYTSETDANLPYLSQYPLALCIQSDSKKIEANSHLLGLFLIWSRGRRVSYDQIASRFIECTPDWVTDVLLKQASG